MGLHHYLVGGAFQWHRFIGAYLVMLEQDGGIYGREYHKRLIA